MATLNTTISILAMSLLLSSASGDLNIKEKQQSANEISSAESTSEAVLIDDFSESINNWWIKSAEMFKLERTDDDELKVTVLSAGAKAGGSTGHDCFGKQFDEMDFTSTPVIRMKIKSTAAGKIRVDLKDAEGKITNAKEINKQMTAGDEFKDFYFDFTDKWVQSYPEAGTVDPVEIVEMLIFINGGGPEFKGIITIDDVEALPVSEYPKQ
jgi:hypothetical protein